MKETKLFKQWRKAKANLQKATAKEFLLRSKLDDLLMAEKINKDTVETSTELVTLTRSESYSVPKAAIPDIQSRIPKKVFKQAFTTSYKLKPAVYNELSGKCKEAITDHLTIKQSPLSISIKEV